MSTKPLVYGIGVLIAGATLAACTLPGSQTTEMPVPPATEMVEQVQVTEPVAETMMAEKNIVETAQAAGQFTTLLQLATQAGLAEALATQELTVFAPTDAAFAKLPAATLKAVQDDPKLLADVLKYHVVQGSVPASEVVTMKSLQTLLGKPLTVTVEGTTVMINDATVTAADVKTSNGIIHIVDTVIVPQQ